MGDVEITKEAFFRTAAKVVAAPFKGAYKVGKPIAKGVGYLGGKFMPKSTMGRIGAGSAAILTGIGGVNLHRRMMMHQNPDLKVTRQTLGGPRYLSPEAKQYANNLNIYI